MEILNVTWFTGRTCIGCVTIKENKEIKTYIGTVRGVNKKDDIDYIIAFGSKVYPEILKTIANIHKTD